MIMRFKLLGEYSTREDFSELQVAECTYKNQTINKIILGLSQESKSLIRDGINKSFIIKNIQESEVELTLDTLKINSANAIITLIKTDFLFAASQIRQVNGE